MQALGERLARTALQAHHTQLFHEWRLQIMRLDLFRINILTVAEDDHVLAAAGDKEVSVSVNVSKIAGVQPPIAENLRRGIRTVVITLHYNWTADEDLSGAIFGMHI